MATPYITPAMITAAPTGVPWNIIPFPKATSEEQLAEQTNICWRASGEVDGFCNQPLRASVDSETMQGPDFRLTVDNQGVARAVTSRWPVLSVLGGRVSARAAFPRQWTTIPASQMEPESTPIGVYGSTGFGAAGAGGNAILVAPGYVSRAGGRNNATLEVWYLNGWPHAGVTAPSLGGATLQVDDVTGFAGASAFIYDGAATEQVQVVSVSADQGVTVPGGSSVPTGPGTVTLASPSLAHDTGVVLSALPQAIPWAAILYAAADAETSGAAAITVQALPGSATGNAKDVASLRTQAEKLLAPYRRVI